MLQRQSNAANYLNEFFFTCLKFTESGLSGSCSPDIGIKLLIDLLKW